MIPSMSSPTRAKATYDDIVALPPHVTGEILAGELYTQARPAGLHQLVSGDLFFDLKGPFGRGVDGPGGWVFVIEPELHLGDDVIVPDLAAWRADRLPIELREREFFEVTPDWVAEVASPSTRRHDRMRKTPAYARHGVPYLWLVEPEDGRIESYAREGEHWTWLATHAEDDAEARIVPFDAVAIDLRGTWRSLRG